MIQVGGSVSLPNDVTLGNANSAAYKTQTIHGKCDVAGKHTHAYTLTRTASLHLFPSR